MSLAAAYVRYTARNFSERQRVTMRCKGVPMTFASTKRWVAFAGAFGLATFAAASASAETIAYTAGANTAGNQAWGGALGNEFWNCPVLMDTFSNPRKRGMRCRDGREEEAQTS